MPSLLFALLVGIIGGLVLSTALSLFVVPAFYVLTDRAKARFASRQETPHLTTSPS